MRGLLTLGIFILLLIIVCQNCSCTNASGARQVLQQNGYTNITITGYSAFCCGSDDTFSTGFVAINPAGIKVKGCVCESFGKGRTIRFN